MPTQIRRYVRSLGLDAYIVGGAVRDELLGIDHADEDFLVPGVDHASRDKLVEIDGLTVGDDLERGPEHHPDAVRLGEELLLLGDPVAHQAPAFGTRLLHDHVRLPACLLLHGAPSGFEDGGEVGERLPGLRRDVALDCRVPRLEAELPGDEDELADDDRLVVGRALERCGSGLGADHALVHGVSPFVSCRPGSPARARRRAP